MIICYELFLLPLTENNIYIVFKNSDMKTVLMFLSISFLALTGLTQVETFVYISEEEEKLVNLLSEKPGEFKPNYNLAKYYYNSAVSLLADQTAGAIPGVEGVDNEIVRLFNAALNRTLSAYESDKKNELVLQMLSEIYFGIGEVDAKVKIDKKLNKLRN